MLTSCHAIVLKLAFQNCVKRMRLDMPVTDEDYVTQYDEEEHKEAADPIDEDALDAAAAAESDEDEVRSCTSKYCGGSVTVSNG